MRTIACDAILIENGKLLLIKRGNMPEKGKWALPGGRLEENETVEECLRREARKETGLEVEPLKLMGVYSDPARDSRKIVSLVYIVKRTGGEPKAGDDAAEVAFFDLNQLPLLAFDHEEIIDDLKKLITLPSSQGRQG